MSPSITLWITIQQNLGSTVIKDTVLLYLWYDYVSQCTGQSKELQCVLQAERGIVLRVIFDAVVDIRDLADVVASILHAKISLQFGPTLQHQLQSLAVVKLQVWRRNTMKMTHSIIFKITETQVCE